MKLKIYIPYFFLFGSWRYTPPQFFFFFCSYMWHSTLWLTLHGVIFPVKLERIHGTVHKDGQVRWGLLVQGRPTLIPGTRYWQARTRVDRNLIYFWSHGVKNLWKRLQFQNINNTSIFFLLYLCWLVSNRRVTQACSYNCIWLLLHYSIFREKGVEESSLKS